MITENIKNCLLDQITKERYSHLLYKQIGHLMTYNKLMGIAKWFYTQGEEESTHCEKIEKYLIMNNSVIEYFTLDKPLIKEDFKELVELFMEALEHEKRMTASLKEIYNKAIKENDVVTQDFLDWFMMEQVEEEYKLIVIIDRFKQFKNVPSFVYDLDQELK